MEEKRIKINYNYLRPKKAKVLKDWHEEEFINKRSLSAKSYHNATILPLKKFKGDNLLFGRGGVVDEKGMYIENSAIDRRVQFSYEHNVEEIKDKRVVYCGYLVNQWGHFLVEAVARLWYFLENDKDVDNYVFFDDENSLRMLTGNYKEFFKLLGVLDKIEIINKPTKYKEIIIPELGYKWREYYNEKYKEIFNRIANNVDVRTEFMKSDKIFFTRSQLPKARKTEYGLEMLDDFFEKNGYKVIAPEKLSLSELILYIRNAKICASVSGSLPHNMLFANDNQKLVILERNILNNEIQVDINHIKGLDVTYIDANIAIYPINLGYGPFILSYRGMLQKFAEENKYKPVCDKYTSKAFMKKCFKKYMKEYKRTYHYQWFMEDWSVKYTDYIREAYLDSLNYFGEYIDGTKPFMLSHYFKLNYIKQIVKSITNK